MNDYLTRVDPEVLEPWKSKEATLWKRTDSRFVRESQRFVVRVPLLYLREKTDPRIVTMTPETGSEFWVNRLRAHLQKFPVARGVSRGLPLDYAVKAATDHILNELDLPLSVHETSNNILEVLAPARKWSRSRKEPLTRLRLAGDPVQFVTNYEPSTILSFTGKTGSDFRKTYWGTIRRVDFQKQHVVIQLLGHLPIYRTLRFNRILTIGDLPISSRGDLTAVRLRDIFIEFDSRKRFRVYREPLSVGSSKLK